MYLSDLGASCLRRWYLVLLFLMMTSGLVYLTGSKIAPTYEAKASVVLVPPKDPKNLTANRYLGLGGLSPAVDVLTRSLNSEETHLLVRESTGIAAPTEDYEAAADVTTSAPILLITANAKTMAKATAILDAALDQVPINLTDLQQALKIEPDAEIISMEVASDDEPQRIDKTRFRLMAGVGAASLLAGATMVAAVDGLLLRRARRREKASQDSLPPDEAELETSELVFAGRAEGRSDGSGSKSTTRRST